MRLGDLDATLVIEPEVYRDLPPHVAAFCSYLIPGDRERLNEHASLTGDNQSYQQIATAGYALARDPTKADLVAGFIAAFEHLSGRTFFAEGRTPRFEVDGVALLGVALGASAAEIPEGDIGWLQSLLQRSSGILQGTAGSMMWWRSREASWTMSRNCRSGTTGCGLHSQSHFRKMSDRLRGPRWSPVVEKGTQFKLR